MPRRGVEPPRPHGHRPSTCRVCLFRHRGIWTILYLGAFSCQLPPRARTVGLGWSCTCTSRGQEYNGRDQSSKRVYRRRPGGASYELTRQVETSADSIHMRELEQ